MDSHHKRRRSSDETPVRRPANVLLADSKTEDESADPPGPTHRLSKKEKLAAKKRLEILSAGSSRRGKVTSSSTPKKKGAILAPASPLSPKLSDYDFNWRPPNETHPLIALRLAGMINMNLLETKTYIRPEQVQAMCQSFSLSDITSQFDKYSYLYWLPALDAIIREPTTARLIPQTPMEGQRVTPKNQRKAKFTFSDFATLAKLRSEEWDKRVSSGTKGEWKTKADEEGLTKDDEADVDLNDFLV